MADETFELEDGEVVASPVSTNGLSSATAAADDVQLRAQLRETAAVARHRRQAALARLALGLVDAGQRDAIWVVDDQVHGGSVFDAFRRVLRRLQEASHDEDELELSEVFLSMVVVAAQDFARRRPYRDIDDEASQQPYRDGGFGVVPASAAAVRTLEKQTFRAAAGGNADDEDGITECGICFDEFVDGVQVTVMPCPSRVHRFHPDCISKWLAISNTCPLCRYELPAYYE